MITYQTTTAPKFKMKVYLDKKLTGEIRRVEGGYQYFPKGSKTGGEISPQITRIRQTLEES